MGYAVVTSAMGYRQVAWAAVLLAVYKYIVDLSYEQTFALYEYWGMFSLMKSAAASKLGWALCFLCLPVLVRLLRQETISALVILLLLLCSYVPFTSLVGYRADYPASYIMGMVAFWIVLYCAYEVIPPIGIEVLRKFGSQLLLPVAILLSVVVLYVWFFYAGMRVQLSLFEGVYEAREEARGYHIPTLLGYVLVLADNILPLLMAYLFLVKRYFFGTLLGLIAFANFSITATKQVVALLFLGVITAIFRKLTISKYSILLILIILMFLSVVEPFVLNTNVLNALLPYRIFFIPSEIHFGYFTFFSENPLDLYRQGPLKLFFSSEYKTGIAFLIGDQMIGQISARANNGLFSEAFMNMGYMGLLITPLFTAFYLRLLDGAARFIRKSLYPLVGALVAFVLIGIPFYTAMLSSGLLALVFCLYLIGEKNINAR